MLLRRAITTLAALLLAATLAACGGGDPCDEEPQPDPRVPTPCAGTNCINLHEVAR